MDLQRQSSTTAQPLHIVHTSTHRRRAQGQDRKTQGHQELTTGLPQAHNQRHSPVRILLQSLERRPALASTRLTANPRS